MSFSLRATGDTGHARSSYRLFLALSCSPCRYTRFDGALCLPAVSRPTHVCSCRVTLALPCPLTRYSAQAGPRPGIRLEGGTCLYTQLVAVRGRLLGRFVCFVLCWIGCFRHYPLVFFIGCLLRSPVLLAVRLARARPMWRNERLEQLVLMRQHTYSAFLCWCSLDCDRLFSFPST